MLTSRSAASIGASTAVAAKGMVPPKNPRAT
jgi:hypothetical protein